MNGTWPSHNCCTNHGEDDNQDVFDHSLVHVYQSGQLLSVEADQNRQRLGAVEEQSVLGLLIRTYHTQPTSNALMRNDWASIPQASYTVFEQHLKMW